ncbi:hypothetical protein [Candidatus Nitrotoga sp. AM1P]|uniref:hypothetical protein n=1 Tax=Candidatus Nitrotoga sp. AM1P TaxID=2559597 RepID=UPI0010B579C1|nr:hypothetical protein [Candidatus Nitrotoga sp. AM1P]BBJ24610.1 hypothetical protein W01_25370 [Candidatus Nitrotoga sp. AM1P]
MFCIVLSSEIFAKEIQNTNSSFIKDDQGKILYIIDLIDNATLEYSEKEIIPGNLDDKDGLPKWHKPEMRRLARHVQAIRFHSSKYRKLGRKHHYCFF